MKNEHEIKKEIRSIDTVHWTNQEYEFLSRRDEDLLTIKEFVAVLKIINLFHLVIFLCIVIIYKYKA
jgi:hypothetical protein